MKIAKSTISSIVKKLRSHITIVTSSLFLLMMSCNTSNALIQENENEFFPMLINGKWILTDTFGNHIEKIQFEELKPFCYELAVAKKGEKYGYIINTGEWKIKPNFDSAKDFYHNCAEVKLNGETFYINRNGKKTKYHYCSESNLVPGCYEGSTMKTIFNVDEYILQNGNKFAIRYEQVKDTTEFVYDSVKAFDRDFFVVERNGKFGFFFRQAPRIYKGNVYIGDTIERYQFDEIVVTPPMINKYSGLFHKLPQVHKYRIGEKWGIIDWQQQRITEPKYDSINLLIDEDYYLVEFDKNKFGYIDQSGKELFKRK